MLARLRVDCASLITYIRISGYTNGDNRMTPAELCKCLGDDTRLRLIVLMRRYGELCVCDLVDALQLPQSTVSRHLSQLRGGGLVSDRRQGQWVYYQLANKVPAWALAVIDELMAPASALYRAELKRGAACCA